MSSPALNSSVVFHIKGYKNATRQLFVLMVVAVIVVLSLLPNVFRDSLFLLFWLFFIAIIVFSIAKVDRMLRWTRLVLSPQGIEYYAYNFQLSSTWEDINLSRKRSIVALYSPVRLTMKNPIVKRNLWFDWGPDVLLGSARYFIPLSPKLWEEYNELVELIKLHRPDLFPE